MGTSLSFLVLSFWGPWLAPEAFLPFSCHMEGKLVSGCPAQGFAGQQGWPLGGAGVGGSAGHIRAPPQWGLR